MSKKTDAKVIDPKEAAALIAADAKARCEEAAARFQAMCDELQVNFAPTVLLAPGKMEFAVNFVPR